MAENVLIQQKRVTSGYNQVNPLIVDENLNTRIGFASGSTSKDIVDYNSKYWWKRQSTKKTYIAKETHYVEADGNYTTKSWAAVSYLVDCDRYASSVTIHYSDSYTISNSGEFILTNAQKLTIVPNSSDAKRQLHDAVVGKYMKRWSNDKEQNVLCYLPPKNNSIDEWLYSNNNYIQFYPATDIKIYTVVETTNNSWELISSDSEKDYPFHGESNGFLYDYLGNPLKDWQNQCKIYCGDYIGTGTGEVQLNFPFQPKFVVVTPKSANNDEYGSSIFAVNYTESYSSFYVNAGTGGSWFSTSKVTFVWGEKAFSFSWDISSDTVIKLNSLNNKYYYIALG